MRIEKRKVKDLKYYKGNPRKMDEKMLEKLKQSIQEFGLVEPLVINTKNEVIGGNQRLKALRSLGIEEVEVVVVDLPKEKEKALNLALNKIQGEWDFELLKEFIEDLSIDELELTGFTAEELELEFEEPEDYNDIPEVRVFDENLFERVDIILTYSGREFEREFMRFFGFKIGCNSQLSFREGIEYDFVDNDYKNYDFETHLEVVKKVRPKYATVRDYLTKEQCFKEGIKYVPLEEILEQAKEISKYAEKVIVIPKVPDVLPKIPEEYVIGFSIPSKWGGSPFSIKELEGRQVHLLGGSPVNQYLLAKEYKNVISIDNNYIFKLANQGLVLMPNGKTISFADFYPGRNLYHIPTICSLLNIFYSYSLFSGRLADVTIEGTISEDELL